MDRETVIRLADESGFDVTPADQYCKQDQIVDSGNLWITDRLERFAAAVEANCVPQWISVEDRLPEDNQQVWTAFNGSMAFAIFSDGRFFDGACFTENEYTEKVTHWMPLPSAPAPKEESTLICPSCKVDRFKEPCPGPMHMCPIKGEAQ